MPPRPGAFVVRVLTRSGQTAGMGVLVGGREILTCAHVVNTALGLDQRAQGQPGEPVVVDFPLLPGAAEAGGWRGLARVTQWVAPPRAGVVGDDIAGLVLTGPPPPGAVPARLAVEVPQNGQVVDVFGYPSSPPRRGGGWVAATVRDVVGGGLLQLDGRPDAALRVQLGYSGSPVCDRDSGRVIGLLSAAPAGASERDSYAVTSERLQLAWPEAAGRRGGGAEGPRRPRGEPTAELTVLHVSDPQFAGPAGAGGSAAAARLGRDHDTVFGRLHDDLVRLDADHGLRPDLMVVTGGLAECGRPSEFEQAVDFLCRLAEAAGLPRRHVAIVPGNHDVNQTECEAYFLSQHGAEQEPVPPYWPKWKHFSAAFNRFYDGVREVSFTPDEPWTLFEMPELAVVVAGLNATMAQSHRPEDHYGWVGEAQLRWFAEALAAYRERGWLRLAAVHHNVVGGAALAEENLRDADALDRLLGQPALANLLLHGHTHDAQLHHLASRLPVISTGRAAGHPEVPDQYQLVTIRPDGITRHARTYAPGLRWIGDTRISPSGSAWQVTEPVPLADVHGTFTAGAGEPGPQPGPADPDADGDAAEAEDAVDDASRDGTGDLSDSFLDRVREATAVSLPEATITVRREEGPGYLRVSNPLPGGGAEQWPVGVVDGSVRRDDLDRFVAGVHAEFAAADPQVRSQLVYSGEPAAAELVSAARRRGVWLRSFVDYQGLLDLRPLAASQAEALAADRRYPPELYVPQRFRLLDDPPSGEPRAGLLDQVVDWLDADGARFVMLLGDFGRGKTFLLRQLARQLPARLPGVVPVLVELRGLEKAPTLDELLAQHLVRHRVESVDLPKLRYMVRSGRLALLFDGFDELALRISYDHAADYLRTLLEAVTGRAKIVLTSRTQHFQSTPQIRTALGDWVSTLGASRVAVVDVFSDAQIREFLAKRFPDDATTVDTRYGMLAGVQDLLGLSQNPRMLSFLAGLDPARLQAVQRKHGRPGGVRSGAAGSGAAGSGAAGPGGAERLSAAELYQDLVDFWLDEEVARQRQRRGMLTLDKEDRLAACTALALRLWTSDAQAIPPKGLSTEVAATLTRLAERGYTPDEAAHAVGSASLLVRADDGAFSFVHQSVVEWLVARAAAAELRHDRQAHVLEARPLTPLMADFLCDLAGHEVARRWADQALAAADIDETTRHNALQMADRLNPPDQAPVPAPSSPPVNPVNLAGADLRGLHLTIRDLRGATLAGADLRGTRLIGTDLTGADLTGVDLRGARLVRATLTGARVDGVQWRRAALLGVTGVDQLRTARLRAGRGAVQLTDTVAAAAVAGRDTADAVVGPCSGYTRCVAISPDSELVAYGQGNAVVLADLATGQPLRVLAGHADGVSGVAFSPDGSLVATSSYDRTARIWETTTGTVQTVLTGHDGRVYGVAFSPDGSLVATASRDRTARIWDAATGAVQGTLTGHTSLVYGVAFSPDGGLVATAAFDRTARIWTAAGAGEAHAVLSGHRDEVYGVAFSPDGSLVATASRDRTARIWDAATGATRTTLTGHTAGVSGVAFSPDGRLVATSSRDRTARIWDAAHGTVRRTLTGHASGVSRVAFSADGTLIATAAREGSARIWETATGAGRITLGRHSGGVTGVAFSPDGTQLVATSSDNTARLWETGTGRTRTVLAGTAGGASAVAFSPDGTLVATASRDRTARIWDAATGTTRGTLDGHTGGVSSVAFSPDGTLVGTGANDNTARLWDTLTCRIRAVLAGHTREVAAVAFSSGGRRVATASYDRTVRLWDTSTGAELTTLDGHTDAVHGVAFAPDGARVATASRDGTARIWATGTGAELVTLAGHTGPVAAVAYSRDGALIATGSADNTARIWDAATGGCRATLTGHTNSISCLAFSPDGALLVTGSWDNTTRIWDAGTGAWLAALIALPDEGAAVLLPDGSYKLDGDPRNALWWAIKLCRFAPGELDDYDPAITRRDLDTPIIDNR